MAYAVEDTDKEEVSQSYPEPYHLNRWKTLFQTAKDDATKEGDSFTADFFDELLTFIGRNS